MTTVKIKFIPSSGGGKLKYTQEEPTITFFCFMEDVIAGLRVIGKIRTSETYATTLSSFKRFRNNIDLQLDQFDSHIVLAYEAFLKSSGVSMNSSSFYMRNLRAMYNRAVDTGFTQQRFPFKHVYTGVDKTHKRALTLRALKKIKSFDFSGKTSLEFARDIFMFSFYTRGMSFIDIAYLRKKDLNADVLTYRRRKTGQQLYIKWEKCMQDIVNKYSDPKSEYLLPIIDPKSNVPHRRQYLYAAHNVNRSLKMIGGMLGIRTPLTMYVSRHSWASIAKSKNVPLSVISEGMGHDSEATTRIYLASLNTVAIDKANTLIINSL
jgi:site-specific recombinase XerD